MAPIHSFEAQVLRLRARQRATTTRMRTFVARLQSLIDQYQHTIDPRCSSGIKTIELLRFFVSRFEKRATLLESTRQIPITHSNMKILENAFEAAEKEFEKEKGIVSSMEKLFDSFASGQFSFLDNGRATVTESEYAQTKEKLRSLGLSEVIIASEEKRFRDDGRILPDPAAIGPFPPLDRRIRRLREKRQSYLLRHKEFVHKATRRYGDLAEVSGNVGEDYAELETMCREWIPGWSAQFIDESNILKEEDLLVNEYGTLERAFIMLEEKIEGMEVQVDALEAMVRKGLRYTREQYAALW
ncbi:hypothetical protein BJ508DRAFT_331051 [Ascobolus immersus RN42]|uniref:Uncharacterized protein n=1 Tax=Ascobolus immersus RN42 TaxID=1160509 RepID=A0A3N4HRP8_ASCIM|nr:hypothetical protein BJ508DRAFT_331051 [Ascobolus immersus RN42]